MRYINIKVRDSKSVWLPKTETRGNENISSMSYSMKKIQRNINCMESFIGFWIDGLNPHS